MRGVKYAYLLTLVPFSVMFDIFYALITQHLASASSSPMEWEKHSL